MQSTVKIDAGRRVLAEAVVVVGGGVVSGRCVYGGK